MVLIFPFLHCSFFQNPEAAAKEGSVVPEMSFPADSGETIQTSDWKGRWTVLYFYPKDDTPGCTAQAKAFTELLSGYKAVNAQIYGINMDSPESHRDFKEKHDIRVTLLTDVNQKASEMFGIRVIAGLCARDSVLINPNIRVEKVYRGVDPSGNPAEILNYIKSKM
ncbi:MAG: peroxiredoxin [Spirochaetia bacterium]|nr:peroxiredoxin [Spirochaetia bacterium]